MALNNSLFNGFEIAQLDFSCFRMVNSIVLSTNERRKNNEKFYTFASLVLYISLNYKIYRLRHEMRIQNVFVVLFSIGLDLIGARCFVPLTLSCLLVNRIKQQFKAVQNANVSSSKYSLLPHGFFFFVLPLVGEYTIELHSIPFLVVEEQITCKY